VVYNYVTSMKLYFVRIISMFRDFLMEILWKRIIYFYHFVCGICK